MNLKALELVDAIQAGYEIDRIRDLAQGAVRIELRRGAMRRRLRFEHYELPAMMQECSCIGVAK